MSEAKKSEVDKAFARGAHPHPIDRGRTLDMASTLDAIAEALSFPDYFGKNLDALYDCLTDLSWLPPGEHVLIWSGSSVLKDRDPKAYLAVRSVLSDAQRALGPSGDRTDSRRLTVVLPD
ncbi:barstar family protein [Amycolatopsis regifaucium]|uniref:Barnase inhibitor n=1 Tax=Amycolatopsis regifaucium TaxID=546365 RepID=A0A154MMG8_9PSEU|nr:barstar family protein [Amycolatopsis regifaucium]KZB85455.1 barnase inhibitor [Amycolatopsis regifaucium]OKA03593.1 barnase inhibitor [Amycolatopsis regifaucium]SFJ51502.1 Barstar (barnase inhibitor) [Amycolatopsis regifaucium]